MPGFADNVGIEPVTVQPPRRGRGGGASQLPRLATGRVAVTNGYSHSMFCFLRSRSSSESRRRAASESQCHRDSDGCRAGLWLLAASRPTMPFEPISSGKKISRFELWGILEALEVIDYNNQSKRLENNSKRFFSISDQQGPTMATGAGIPRRCPLGYQESLW